MLLNVASGADVSVNLLLANTFLRTSKSTLCYETSTLCCSALSNNLYFPIKYMSPALSIPAINTQPGNNPSWDKTVIKDTESLAINYSITLPVLLITPSPRLDDT